MRRDTGVREQSSCGSFRLTRRGRVAARPTNGVCPIDEQRQLGGQVGIFDACLGEELVHEFLPCAQMRQRGLTNGMAWDVDLERRVDERAASLRSRAEGILDHLEKREDRRLAGLLGPTPRVGLEGKDARRLRSLSASATSRSFEPKCWYRVRFVTPARAAIASTPVFVMPCS